ncbi:DUF5947 family protein [Saccharomonospora sp. NPDC046836]|uniref:DUF5947 family protein n=1 Tax=Saccharomonospora sp. NPDC046836 TaxID=3156921 RepID=UPI0033EE071B
MTGPSGALHRAIRRSAADVPAAPERCDLCAADLPERHRHVLDEQRGELLCTCRACTLLFEKDAAGRGHYRLVPEERVRLSELPPQDLGVPVGLAFFVPQPDGTVVAHYPSPVGATQWEVEAEAWQAMRRSCPPLAKLSPGVQALLVNTARGRHEHWIVPIDDCYRLVAVIRREWQGLSGGSHVWPAIDDFFAELDRQHTREKGNGHG